MPTPPRSRRPRPRDADATRQRLLDAATEEFAEAGLAGARVDAIAARAGVNKRMIYVYFGDKEALYREVLSSHLAVPPLGRELDADPRAALTELVRWYFRLLASDPAFARLLAWGLLTGTARRHAVLVASAGPALDRVAEVVRRGVASGVFRRDTTPETLRTAITSLCVGYFVQRDAMKLAQRRDGVRFTDEEFLESVTRLVFEGVAAGRDRA